MSSVSTVTPTAAADLAVTHRVLRPFEATGAVREIGELLDCSSWVHTRKLVDTRYLAPVDIRDITPFVSPDGRAWLDEAAFRRVVLRDLRARAAVTPSPLADDSPEDEATDSIEE